MIIGVNCLYMIPGGVGGTEVYLKHLLEALSEIDASSRYVLFANEETGSDWFPVRSNFQIVRCQVRATIRWKRILYEQLLLPIVMTRWQVAVLLNPGFTAPMACGVPMVTVVHDLQHKRHPEFFRKLDLPFWRLLVYLAVVRSRRLIAVSESTAADIASFYGSRAAAKTMVVPHGVDAVFFQIAADRTAPAGDSRTPYILCVSTLHPHKNLARLLAAFRFFLDTNPDYRLVIAGLRGFATEALHQERRRLELEDCVRFTGWIPRSELLDLFRNARAFIYPSLFEGFGMPVLEALAAGLPVACSRIPPLLEIAGDDAVFFDPHETAAMTESLKKITGMARLSSNHAAQYTWQATAQQTYEILQAAARQN